jgi:hypothetical protein
MNKNVFNVLKKKRQPNLKETNIRMCNAEVFDEHSTESCLLLRATYV